MKTACLLFAALAVTSTTHAADALLIRDATVHAVDGAGAREHTDVLIEGGVIRALGARLTAPAGAEIVEAKGRPLTPGLFAGLNALGVQEVSLEPTTNDATLAFGAQQPPADAQWRPEFDLVPAFNPHSVAIAINRAEGLTFTVLAPGAMPGGSIIAGQGAAMTLDGRYEAMLPNSRTLFIELGGDLSALTGGSRAAQYMLLDQAVREAKTGETAANPLLTPAGRDTLNRYLAGGRVAFGVQRAADIRQVLAFAKRSGMRPVIVGGAEAWMVADELAAAKVPVMIDALAALPSSFDQLGARLDNAALLHRAGVTIAFAMFGDNTQNARKIRQLAGNAVAHGLDWDTALAALTATPARVFGQSDSLGRIAPGLRADVVLWSGDPLEVTSFADQVWIAGKPMPTTTRQTELRDRYLRR